MGRLAACPRTHADECAVCLLPLVGPHVRLPCGHCYHGDCAAEWMLRARTCPQCRKRVVTGRVIVVKYRA